MLDVNELEERFGPFFAIDDVRQRVRCTNCRRRTQQLRVVIERR